MKKDYNQVSVPELKRLLVEIRDKRPDIFIRYRLLGEMWRENFLRVMLVSEKGAVFNDEVRNTTYVIPDLKNIIQFEIDSRFQAFQPFSHYDVNLSAPEVKIV